MTYKKKLIEVALPLDAINKASVRESYIYRGNPSAVHKWWAQRPLAAARAVIFSQMVDDPSAHPDLFPTEKAQEKERQRLFRIIEDLVLWENTTNETVLQRARDEIWQSWRYTCAENADHPRAKELFDRHKLPAFHDPFAGGGTLPLEAQRLGLESFASDLNPVAVLITKALIEFPPRFVGKSPVNPTFGNERTLISREWCGAQGLAEDVRYYGNWMREEAEKRIGHFYPQVIVTKEMTEERPDLKQYVGQNLTAIAWLWARTVKSPNPAFAQTDVPLASTFMLSTKAGKETYIAPVFENGGYRFTVKVGKPKDVAAAKKGTSAGKRKAFFCLLSGVPIGYEYIRSEAKKGRMGARLMAVVVEGNHGRVYLPTSLEMESIALNAKPDWRPDCNMPLKHRNFQPPGYGMSNLGDIFTSRQLVALTTFSDLVQEVHARVVLDALAAGHSDDARLFVNSGSGAVAYADAVATLLAFSVDKTAEYGCTIVPWYAKEDRPKGLFARQSIPMVWDYAEVNPLADIGGAFGPSLRIVAGSLSGCPVNGKDATARQADAVFAKTSHLSVISTDPPYYDNIAYADLSDFFYVWLRRSLKAYFPDIFATVEVPKSAELVATPTRHGGKKNAESFFLNGMTRAMQCLADQAHPAFPVTIYYAYKQSETAGDSESSTFSTGWDTFLDAVIRSGFSITGTWPMRTERGGRSIDIRSNALASSIVLVCRPRAANALSATRREFVNALRTELPEALANLRRGNVAPVDLEQATFGPGMAIFTRYSHVLNAEGNEISVRDALALINQTLDEALIEQEGDFDADSRWALAWFGDHGFDDGPFGDAHTYFVRFNTAENALKQAGIIDSGRGRVRLFKPNELPNDWNPMKVSRLTVWEMVHHLIRVLESGGEDAASELVAKLGSKSEHARELAYRLYTVCERNRRAPEALSYNGLVQSWPEITRLARESGKPTVAQGTLFGDLKE